MVVSNPKIMTPANARQFAGLQITSTRESINNGLVIALYGQGGVGKTTMAAMITKSKNTGKALIFDAEAGSSAVAHLGDTVDTTPITRFSQLDDAGKALDRWPPDEPLPYDNYIFDNMTEMMHMRIQEIAGPGKDIQIQHWGTCTADFLRETRRWRDRARKLGINVIFCVWEDREKDESLGNKWTRRVFFTPKLAQAFPGIVTMVGHILPVQNMPEYRKVSFQASEITDSKWRAAPNENAAQIPLEIYYKADMPVLADILDTIKQGTAWPASKYPRPQRQTS